jgi:hypothetical protein
VPGSLNLMKRSVVKRLLDWNSTSVECFVTSISKFGNGAGGRTMWLVVDIRIFNNTAQAVGTSGSPTHGFVAN